MTFFHGVDINNLLINWGKKSYFNENVSNLTINSRTFCEIVFKLYTKYICNKNDKRLIRDPLSKITRIPLRAVRWKRNDFIFFRSVIHVNRENVSQFGKYFLARRKFFSYTRKRLFVYELDWPMSFCKGIGKYERLLELLQKDIFFRNSRIFPQNHSKLNNQAFAKICFAAIVNLQSLVKVFEFTAVLLNFLWSLKDKKLPKRTKNIWVSVCSIFVAILNDSFPWIHLY